MSRGYRRRPRDGVVTVTGGTPEGPRPPMPRTDVRDAHQCRRKKM